MKNLVIYHSDMDGICSAAIVNQFETDCEFYPINYGQSVPWNKIEKADKVIMCDFSLQPFNDMLKLLKLKGNKFLWIDHHETAIKDEKRSGQRFQGIREVGKAGCELVWEWFCPESEVPQTIRMCGRYDVWDLDYHKDVLPFHYGMMYENLEPTDRLWDQLLDTKNDTTVYNEILQIGKICYQYQMMKYNQQCKISHFEMEWEGLKWIVCNALNCNSGLFEGYFDTDKHDAMLCFGWIKDKWTISMYTNKEGIDVSRYVKIINPTNSGGHKNAAGAQTDDISFILDNRI